MCPETVGASQDGQGGIRSIHGRIHMEQIDLSEIQELLDDILGGTVDLSK